jgi:hypothetical protein
VKHDSENKEQTIASSNTEKTRDIEFKENQCIDVQAPSDGNSSHGPLFQVN